MQQQSFLCWKKKHNSELCLISETEEPIKDSASGLIFILKTDVVYLGLT